jgi:hypothetical protein
MLALGAINRLYNPAGPKLWANVLDTFSNALCTPGLIDKGDLGELAAQTLFILARDYAAPLKLLGRDFSPSGCHGQTVWQTVRGVVQTKRGSTMPSGVRMSITRIGL